MTKKKAKTFTVKGFTNRELKQTLLFGGGIVSIDKCLEICNELDVRFCTKERHRKCQKNQACALSRPRYEMDERYMVGKKGFDNITKADYKKIETMLKRFFNQCRQIEITATEI